MHAVVIRVKIDTDFDLKHRHEILDDFAIPKVKAMPGFTKGMWMNKGDGDGICIIPFDAKEHAKAAVDSLTSPRRTAVISCYIYQMDVEA